MPSLVYILLLVGLGSRAHGAEVQCWAPDGVSVAPNDTYVPCNKLGITQQGVFSSCCKLDGEEGTRDLCATSGLCLRQGIVRREFCTDPTWKSPACVNICTDPQWGGNFSGSVELTPCASDGTFCCGNNNLTCCGTEWAITVPTQVSVVVPNITTTAFVTETAQATPSIAAVAGLGGSLGLVMLIAAGIIFYLTRQNKTLRQRAETAELNNAAHLDPYRASYIPGSSLPTTVVASSHVPSMQDFMQFKMLYGNALSHQASAQEINGIPHRYSELDANTVAAMGHLNQFGSPPPQMERLAEEPRPSPPTGPPPPPHQT